ncbi:hypothetical protein IEQ34_015533 [Dendrobium chrysotoxum]|uniref:Uncharacterized protein n=1 Tax=Dendrobium chrysotoxum TaxID=161865 RepID=A0AAV7GGF4_DENCH|nr:hypothetical protein IEQ34_015533 [Dendrobium chrysotoxum]
MFMNKFKKFLYLTGLLPTSLKTQAYMFQGSLIICIRGAITVKICPGYYMVIVNRGCRETMCVFVKTVIPKCFRFHELLLVPLTCIIRHSNSSRSQTAYYHGKEEKKKKKKHTGSGLHPQAHLSLLEILYCLLGCQDFLFSYNAEALQDLLKQRSQRHGAVKHVETENPKPRRFGLPESFFFNAGGAMTKIFILILLLRSATSTAARDMFKGQVSLSEKATAEGTSQGEESRKGSPAKTDETKETEKAIVHKQREMFVDVNVIMPDGNSPGTHHTIDAVDYCKQNTWCNERLSQP